METNDFSHNLVLSAGDLSPFYSLRITYSKVPNKRIILYKQLLFGLLFSYDLLVYLHHLRLFGLARLFGTLE